MAWEPVCPLCKEPLADDDPGVSRAVGEAVPPKAARLAMGLADGETVPMFDHVCGKCGEH